MTTDCELGTKHVDDTVNSSAEVIVDSRISKLFDRLSLKAPVSCCEARNRHQEEIVNTDKQTHLDELPHARSPKIADYDPLPIITDHAGCSAGFPFQFDLCNLTPACCPALLAIADLPDGKSRLTSEQYQPL